MEKKSITISVFLVLAIIALAFLVMVPKNSNNQEIDNKDSGNQQKPVVVTNFDECAAAGYVVLESYPRQCQAPTGETFTEYIGNELDKQNLIRIDSPRPNATVNSPVTITGEARGHWFFEASFPIRIYDANGKELGWAIAQAQSDWMTEDFVRFEAVLNFEKSTTKKGLLVLQKDNPSGLPEKDDKLEVPIVFGEEQAAMEDDTQKVLLYYYSEAKDPDISCSKDGLVELERNIFVSDDIIASTIQLLLEGKLTDSEKASGILTEFPLSGLSLISSSLNDGELTLTFSDPENKTSGGSCRVNIMWSEIEATAKQFPEVKSVKFMPEELFQP
jgi:spore germination protein GerM